MKHEIYARVQGFNDEHHGKSETRRIRYTCFELPSASQCIWLTLHSTKMLKQTYINQVYLIRLVCDFPWCS